MLPCLCSVAVCQRSSFLWPPGSVLSESECKGTHFYGTDQMFWNKNAKRRELLKFEMGQLSILFPFYKENPLKRCDFVIERCSP